MSVSQRTHRSLYDEMYVYYLVYSHSMHSPRLQLVRLAQLALHHPDKKILSQNVKCMYFIFQTKRTTIEFICKAMIKTNIFRCFKIHRN